VHGGAAVRISLRCAAFLDAAQELESFPPRLPLINHERRSRTIPLVWGAERPSLDEFEQVLDAIEQKAGLRNRGSSRCRDAGQVRRRDQRYPLREYSLQLRRRFEHQWTILAEVHITQRVDLLGVRCVTSVFESRRFFQIGSTL